MNITSPSTSRAWIELDPEALKRNVEFLQSRLPKSCRFMPAVKAEAYGHGACLIAEQLTKMGIDSFCVACVDEAVSLRLHGIEGEILILGYTHPAQFPLLQQYHLSQTIVDASYAALLDQYGKECAYTFPVHLAIDTGMHRLGEPFDRTDTICRLFHLKHLKIDGIFTHLSADDSLAPEACAFTRMQVEHFEQVLTAIKKQGLSLPKVHMLASYGILNYPELGGDYARIGIALYGVVSTAEDSLIWSRYLSPVLSLKCRIASVRDLKAGDCAGYGVDYHAPKDMRIATLTIGYADGLPRNLSNGTGSVLIHGHRAPIVGRICMDQTLVDISDIPETISAGDIAVLIGISGSLQIRAEEVAEQSGSITNEVLSRLGVRLPRLVISPV
mgnify:FL=1